MELIERDSRTSREIAHSGGFSPPSLTMWSKNGVIPSADQLAALARVFDVPLDYFFEAARKGTDRVIVAEGPKEQEVDDLLEELQRAYDAINDARQKAKEFKSSYGHGRKSRTDSNRPVIGEMIAKASETKGGQG